MARAKKKTTSRKKRTKVSPPIAPIGSVNFSGCMVVSVKVEIKWEKIYIKVSSI